MFCFWASFLADVSYLVASNAKGGGFTPDRHVIFHVTWFFNTNGDIAKNNWLKNVYGGVCFNKIASLCCTNCNSTITCIHQSFFPEYVSKNYIPSSTTKVSLRGFYKILEKFLQDICHFLSYKVADL